MLTTHWHQRADEVLVRDPEVGAYGPPEPARNYAPLHWEYAAMSNNAYEEATLRARKRNPTAGAAVSPKRDHIRTPGWERWPDFPGGKLLEKLASSGLYVEVYEKTTAPLKIAVVFEGTNFGELPDWRANFRWFLRFVPSYEDQYTITADEVARAFYERLQASPGRYVISPGSPVLRTSSNEPIRLVAAGHSLGGGLAQHFAYAFQQPFASGGPRVSEVFAFDPSPVTGWSVVPRGLRQYNATDLRINRIFEHGEAMAYLRLITSRLARYSKHPSVWEYRYNFDPSLRLVRNHSIHNLAEGLLSAAKGLTS